MNPPEVLQAFSISAGIVTTFVGVVLVRIRSRSARELKQLDVSAEWQKQMLERIAAVEAELQCERLRNDSLEKSSFEWRRQAADLQWELRASKAQRHELEKKLQAFEQDNNELRKQNNVLASELREMHRQIRGGYQGLSVRPPALPAAKAAKKE
jgi:septal ring factor EnvC (AmiA/AmiB activator)